MQGLTHLCSSAPLLPCRSYPFVLITFLLLSLTACGATVTPPPPVFISAAGSTSMAPLLGDLAAAYRAQHPHVTFDIQGGGSQLGQTLVEGKQVDLGLVSWPVEAVADDIHQVVIARGAVAIVLHPNNHIAGLSLDEVRDIFSGRLLDWRALDGPALPIQVVSREDGSGTRAAFEALVMEDRAVTPAAIVLPNSRAVVDFVAQHPDAIAYVSFEFIDNKVNAVPLNGFPPTLENIETNSYPLTRDLSIIVPQRPNPEVNRFVEFILSPAGQAVVGQKWGRID